MGGKLPIAMDHSEFKGNKGNRAAAAVLHKSMHNGMNTKRKTPGAAMGARTIFYLRMDD